MTNHDAAKHPRYTDAVAAATLGGWNPFWIQTNADVRAVVENGCWFDDDIARKMTAITPKVFKHSEAEWKGKPFIPEWWQILEIYYPLFGWRKPAPAEDNCDIGYRRFSSGYIAVPRKNGKTITFAAIGMTCMMADRPIEYGAEVFCVSEDVEQAESLQKFCIGFMEENHGLKNKLRFHGTKRQINLDRTRSWLKVISGKPKHGKGAHVVLADELHQWTKRELWKAVQTGSGHRRQALRLSITTAGWDRESICWEQHEYAQNILDGTIDDPNFLAVIYAAGPEDDWTDEEVWKKANPNYGVTIRPENMRADFEIAKNNPAYQNTFRQLYLNQWTQQSERWVDMAHWADCRTELSPDFLLGRPCYGGVDLSKTTDLTALAWVFPPISDDDLHWYGIVKTFTPHDRLKERELRDKAQYTQWEHDGWLTLAGDKYVDYRIVRDTILEDMKLYDVVEIGVDPANATQFKCELADDFGAPMVDVYQSFGKLSPALKRWSELIVGSQWQHFGNPVETWCVGNLTVKINNKGDVMPDKSKRTTKIDPVSAIVTALARGVQHSQHGSGSLFKGQDLMFVEV